MCGIWGFISKKLTSISQIRQTEMYNSFQYSENRGPDRSRFQKEHEIVDFFLGFHRLSIMDKTIWGDQPFVCQNEDRIIYLMCNGEIYNFKELKEEYNLQTISNSDCEVILHLYNVLCNNTNSSYESDKKGFEELLYKIKDNEFAFCIIDINLREKRVITRLATDPCSVRPLFYASTTDGLYFSSILRSLSSLIDATDIKRFNPGTYYELVINIPIFSKKKQIQIFENTKTYFKLDISPQYRNYKNKELLQSQYLLDCFEHIKHLLQNAVIRMLHSDRPLGALLSGGLDSSLVVAIASKYLQENYGKQLQTFSIGLPGSTDEKYAKMVAMHCNTIHTHIELTNDDFLNALDQVILATETYDITTIRASTGQYLISKYISENTDIKVLLIGDGSDELFSGYMYFHNNPNETQSHLENIKLLKDIHLYDGLRADRCIAYNGLEARIPFLNAELIDYVLKTDPRLRVPIDKIEKWLLRKSFEGTNYLPNEILWRKKEAFSDGVSQINKSWYEIIQEHLDDIYSNDEFDELSKIFIFNKPHTKESLYYRIKFCEYFTEKSSHIIPYFWLPNWCGNIKEPSARILKSYE